MTARCFPAALVNRGQWQLLHREDSACQNLAAAIGGKVLANDEAKKNSCEFRQVARSSHRLAIKLRRLRKT
jgi:hypothetical protein